MKKTKILIVVLLLLFTTGCGSAIKDNNKKMVVYKKTGQSLQNNILCRPTNKELINLYNKYNKQLKVKMEKLPECKNFKVTSNKSTGIWEFLFVKPLAFIILKLGYAIKNFGLSVMIIGVLIRVILLPFSKKSQMQAESMKKATPEIQRLEVKYKGKTDKESMLQKSQETMMIYKKYGVNPMSGCLLAFIQLPLFFGFLQAINRVPAIFEGRFLNLSLGMTPSTGISKGNYFYLILILLVMLTTYYSFKKSLSQTGQTGQSKSMLITMLFMIFIASFSFPTAIALYWIVTNAFIIIQNYLIEKSMSKGEKKPEKKSDIIKDKKKVSIKEKTEKRRGN